MNAIVEQFKKLWLELGFTQRISLGLAMVAIGIAMTGLVMWSSKPDMSLLYARINPKDMGEIVEVLESNGVPYRLEQGGTAIFAPKDMIPKMRIELAGRSIPNGGGVGFEIFDRTNFGISDFIQRTNYMRAIQGELARTIAEMQGIRSARVMVVVPENKLLVNNEKARATASVFVETTGNGINKDAVNAIRFLVSNSVDGLLVDDVAIVNQKGEMLTADMKDEPLMTMASGQFRFRQGLENYFSQKIETLLGKVLGSHNVVARVSVDVDMQSVTHRSQTFDPEGQVIRTQTDTQDTHSTSEVKPGAPAPQSSGSTGAPAAPSTGSTNTTQDVRKNKTIAYEINQSTVETIKAPGEIKKITAAVFIAQKLGEDGKPIARSADELNRLKQMVFNAIGSDMATNTSSITLEEVPFESSAKPSVPIEPPLIDKVSGWVDIASKIAPVGLGIAMFLGFMIVLKRAKNKTAPIEFIQEVLEGTDLKPKKTTITPEVLNRLIKEDPLAVSGALKTWVSSESK